ASRAARRSSEWWSLKAAESQTAFGRTRTKPAASGGTQSRSAAARAGAASRQAASRDRALRWIMSMEGPRPGRGPSMLMIHRNALSLLAACLLAAPARAAADLDWVPPDAAGFVRVLPKAVWDSAAFKDHHSLLRRAAREA